MDCGHNLRALVAVVALMIWGVSATYEPQAVSRSKRSVIEVDNPQETFQVLGTLAQRILEAESPNPQKRGLDFGLSRGFSGSQAAKHLMGLSAASFSHGPGRKRRSLIEHQ